MALPVIFRIGGNPTVRTVMDPWSRPRQFLPQLLFSDPALVITSAGLLTFAREGKKATSHIIHKIDFSANDSILI